MGRNWKKPTIVAAALCAFLWVAGCNNGGNSDSKPAAPTGEDYGAVVGTSATPSADLTAIAQRVSAVLALGYNTTTPDVVMKQLSGLDSENKASDLAIIDTREPADFAKGHIPGAINIPLQSLPQALLDQDSRIPMDKNIVVASYWGNDGNMASLLINIARIADPANAGNYPKSTALFQGMTSWNFDRELVPAGTRFDDALAAGVRVEDATEAGTVSPQPHESYPDFASFNLEPVVQKILIRASDYLNSVPSQFDLEVYPKSLADNLADGDAANDPQIVSVRAANVYVGGHIPGAINIPYKNVADLENAADLDPTKDVVVYCYTGHTGALSTMALGILGYHAQNLLYGMNGWSTTAPGSGQLANFDLNRSWDFPLNTDLPDGVDSLAAYIPPSTGCQSCHTSLTAIWEDTIKTPLAAEVAPPSEGEG
jgi:rhodanese-related sulfurtransferase